MPRATIIIPLDGSALAESSLNYLPALKGLGQFEVLLMLVIDRDQEPAALGERAPREYLERIADRVREATGLEVSCWVTTGIPYASILAESENPWVAMIITTTHGLTGLQRWRMGSVADKVIRGAPCPVFVIGPANAGAPASFERMLVPLDGSPLAEEALPAAKLMALRLGAAMRLLRCVTPRAIPDELAGSLSADVIESYELLAGKYLDEAKLELEATVPVERAVVTGPADDVIIGQVEETPCDLVVMTSHGRHGFIRYALGSVSERVIGASRAPVLLVKPGEGERLKQIEPGNPTPAS